MTAAFRPLLPRTRNRKHCRPGAGVDERILGWAALSPVSSRDVYAGVAGVSVFRRVGVREEVASDRGAWRDTVILEWQSRRVGLP